MFRCRAAVMLSLLMLLTNAAFADADSPARVPLNLAQGKPATASNSQPGNRPEAAVDGDKDTRWCAVDGSTGYTWQVDLQQPEDVTSCRITWEFDDDGYRYKVDGSADGKTWSTLVDATSGNAPTQGQHLHKLDAKGIRFARVTVTGSASGHWASIREFELYGSKLIDPAALVVSKTASLLKDIKAPAGLKVTIFAMPPEVSYPVCLEAAVTGEVFVAVDPNGSLDQKTGRGRIIRCRDTNADGVADEFKTFAKVDSPRGMVWDAATRTMYVQHPPFIQAYHDDDGDGVSDRSDVLVEGLGYDLKFRGADHTTNGMQIGIDGWLYVAVGDYGFVSAKTRDGKTLQLHGGGVVRVRPDGTQLEIVSRGQRNIYDVAISPTLDLFTRDNTNDGDGWDVRLSHVIPTGNYGYPSLFKNFPDEIVQPLGIYGGGSPTGSLYLDEPGGIARGLYACDWGTNQLYAHPLKHNGAGFTAEQKTFLEFSRPIDMTVDGESRVYVASWRGGGFAYSGPDVGYVARIVDPKFTASPLPELTHASEDILLAQLAGDSHVRRLAAQREILRRGEALALSQRLEELARSAEASLPARVAATFTLAQLAPSTARPRLIRIAADDAMREFALRALADTRDPGIARPEPFAAALDDANPRVRLAAIVALARLGKAEEAPAIVPHVADIDPLVAHAAVNALVALHAVDPCFAAIDAAQTALVPGVIRALQAQHDPRVVDGLLKRIDTVKDPETRRQILKALCRLYYREADWSSGWWGTRPDTSGPYYYPTTWDASARVLEALRRALEQSDDATRAFLFIELLRHKIDIDPAALPPLIALLAKDRSLQGAASDIVAVRPAVPKSLVGLLLDAGSNAAQDVSVRARALSALARSPEPDARDAAVLTLSWLKPDAPAGLLQVRSDFVRDPRHAADVGYFAGVVKNSQSPGIRGMAYAVLLQVATAKQSPPDAAATARKVIDGSLSDPALLRAVGTDKVDTFAEQVQARLNDPNPAVKEAAAYAMDRIGKTAASAHNKSSGVLISTLPFEQARTDTLKHEGDAALGAQLFLKQGCVACHTVSKNEPPKGPFLGGIAKRYSRAELVESILKPNAKIAQGFVTHYFVTKKRERVDGFITRESGDEVEVRTANGASTVIKNADVARKGTLPTSIMPEGLADNLSPDDLASLLAYLESLKAE